MPYLCPRFYLFIFACLRPWLHTIFTYVYTQALSHLAESNRSLASVALLQGQRYTWPGASPVYTWPGGSKEKNALACDSAHGWAGH